MKEEKIIREYLVEVLAEQHRNELEGKGYDFYFKLRTDLDELNRKLEAPNPIKK